MRWFKHFTDARHNPKFRAIEKKLGEAGYARACKLLEIVGERGGSGKEFAPRLDLNEPHTDLGWLADEMEIDRRSAKVTLAHFAKCKFIDPEAYQRNIVYVPQMIEYLDEWTRKRQPRDSGATPESLRTNSPQSKSQSKKSELEVDKEVEGDDKSKSDDPSANEKLTSIPPSFSLNEKPNVTGKSDVTTAPRKPAACVYDRLPKWMHGGPWEALEIDRARVPEKFLIPSWSANEEENDLAENFEYHFKRWWDNYRMEYLKDELDDGIPVEFAEYALEQAEDTDVEYPPILLRRKKELEVALTEYSKNPRAKASASS
jgi:hypothetical protein